MGFKQVSIHIYIYTHTPLNSSIIVLQIAVDLNFKVDQFRFLFFFLIPNTGNSCYHCYSGVGRQILFCLLDVHVSL